MNNPLVMEMARRFAGRPDVASISDPARRIARMYRLAFQRDPTGREVAIGQQFLSTPQLDVPALSTPSPSPWHYGHGEYDPVAKRVKSFEPLCHWTGDGWQPGPKRPDPRLGELHLTREGGHPGPGFHHAAIRRWVAPWRGTMALTGRVSHQSRAGDGVLALIVSSRSGELGRWVVHARQAKSEVARVEVEPGDTLDFLVTGRDDPAGDAFSWAPQIQAIEPKSVAGEILWKADADFSGPSPEPPRPMAAWEEFAQVLLLSNEFALVD